MLWRNVYMNQLILKLINKFCLMLPLYLNKDNWIKLLQNKVNNYSLKLLVSITETKMNVKIIFFQKKYSCNVVLKENIC